jgi:hypothetical protein
LQTIPAISGDAERSSPVGCVGRGSPVQQAATIENAARGTKLGRGLLIELSERFVTQRAIEVERELLHRAYL